MTQRIAGLARWVFALELGTCFVWPTLLFVALLAMSASMSPAVGYPSVAWLASMLAATVLGPLGLAVALDVLVRGRTRFNEVGIAVLAASAAWAFVAFTLQASAEDWSRPAINSWVLLALLPAIGAAHLLCAVWAARRGGATSAARQSR